MPDPTQNPFVQFGTAPNVPPIVGYGPRQGIADPRFWQPAIATRNLLIKELQRDLGISSLGGIQAQQSALARTALAGVSPMTQNLYETNVANLGPVASRLAELTDYERKLGILDLMGKTVQQGAEIYGTRKRIRKEEKKPKKKFGGLFGSLGGAGLGAILGSIVPGVGTLIGAGIGSQLGSAAGEATGK